MRRSDQFDFGGEYLDRVEASPSLGEDRLGSGWKYSPAMRGKIRIRFRIWEPDRDWGCTGTGDCFDP